MKLCLEMSDKDTSSPVSIECITMYNAGVAGSGVGCVVQLCCSWLSRVSVSVVSLANRRPGSRVVSQSKNC